MADLITLGVEVQTTGGAQAAQGLGAFQKAAQGAAGAADQLENKVNALGAAQNKIPPPARALTGAMNGLGSAFENNSGAIQNTSFQLQDILVQMEMGVPITRTLGQQLPQLLGGFGPLGAVIGLAVGALLTFAPALFSSGESAKDLTDTVKELEDAVNAYSAASKEAVSPTSQLTEQYGKASDKVRELLQLNKELAKLDAIAALSKTAAELVLNFGDFGTMTGEQVQQVGQRVIEMQKAIDLIDATPQEQFTLELDNTKIALEANIAQLARYTSGIDQVQGILGSTQAQAVDFAAALADLQSAVTLDEQIAALANIRTLFIEIKGGAQNMTDEQRALLTEIVRTSLATYDLADGTATVSSNLDTAASGASRMADELSRALGAAVSLAQQSFTARVEADIKLKYAGDPLATAGALAASRFDRTGAGAMMNAPTGAGDFTRGLRDAYIANEVAAAEAQLALADFNKEVKGGASGAKEAAADIKRYYDATRTDGEKYADGLAEISALHASGAMDADLYARSVEELTLKFDPLGQLISDLAGTVENELNAAFASVLDGTASLGDALLSFASNVLAKVAQDLFAQQFASPIASGLTAILGGVAGGLAGAPITSPRPMPRPFEDGGIFDQSGVTPFAKGGIVSGPTIFPFANGTGLMGEAGPEAIMPLSRGSDGKLGVAAANGNSAPKITINNYSGQEASTSSDNMGNIIVEIGRAIAQDITGGGPTYRAIKSTFGISNRLQQRG